MTDLVGNIGLEALMDRANIIFTNGYVFKGEVNPNELELSFKSIINSVSKFNFQLNYISQNNFHWSKFAYSSEVFHYENVEDLTLSFQSLSSKSIKLIGIAPMMMTLLKSQKDNEFIIAVSTNHTYMDARSANYVFNQVIKHYNASIASNIQLQESSIETIKSLGTEAGCDFVDKQLKIKTDVNNTNNINGILDYEIQDVGKYGINRSDLSDCMAEFCKTDRLPQISQHDVNNCIAKCRSIYPQITKNSIVCALLAKSVYLLNIAQRQQAKSHKISFKMLSDLLNKENREKLTGNYISFVPVTVDGEKTLPEIALQIHNRIVEFKTKGIDLSMFSLTEQAIEQELVGTSDEALSFIVTNWNNYNYLNSNSYLTNCESLKHLSAVNIEPKDNLGAALVNRPVAVVNFSPNSELCLSFFPSLRNQKENKDLLTQFKTILNS